MSLKPKLNIFSSRQRKIYNAFQVLDHFIGRPNTVKLFGKIRYKAFLDIASTLEASGEGKQLPIETRTDLGLKEFKEHYVKKGIPVIFKGAAKEWDCVNNWSPQYFKDLYGQDNVHIVDENDPTNIKSMDLYEVIEQIQKGNSENYFRFYNLLTRHPEHITDFDLDWLKQHRHKNIYFESFQVFIGGSNSTTALHNAHISNLFVQAYGKKKWILYPNYYVPFIDPPSTMNGIYRSLPIRSGGKPFNPFEPDYEGYPYFKYLDSYSAVLEPGDILYNPPYMWHGVKNLTESIGVGYRWANFLSSFKSSPTYYMLDLMAYRPNYIKSLKMVKKDPVQQFIHRQKYIKKVKISK